jgi:hypothetical protein
MSFQSFVDVNDIRLYDKTRVTILISNPCDQKYFIHEDINGYHSFCKLFG